MSSSDMMHYEYNELPFAGKWFELMGKPSSNFHALIFGKPKMGKSYLAVAFAKYLSSFGKVLYIASEEGFSSTLKKKISDFGLDKSNVDFGNFRDFNQIQNVLRSNNYDFVFIDSVNFINLSPQQVEDLKDMSPETAFITIQQATKQGYARGSPEFAHNSDIIIEVVDGVAYAQGRFGPPSEMNVFPRPQQQQLPMQQQSFQQPFQQSTNSDNLDFDVNDYSDLLL
jgi:predicted ATP-dependent serine protease